MERLYVCLSDRFLEERNFGNGKVSKYNTILYPTVIMIAYVCCYIVGDR